MDFRGRFPAASLKLRGGGRGCVCKRYFRGRFPAASLKRGGGLATGASDRHFRGRFPAASLKRGAPGDHGADAPEFPREVSRGLIEATMCPLPFLVSYQISAGGFPRPH